MCQVLKVSRSGYYDWNQRPVSCRERANQKLTAEIKEIFTDKKRIYGSPRIHQELLRRGYECGVNRVARLMSKEGLVAVHRRKFRVTTKSNHKRPVAENQLKRQFSPSNPNEAWAADITYIYTREGFLYLSVILDLCSRKVIGWSMSERLKDELTVKSLEMAIENRGVQPGQIVHTDQGIQYTSQEFQKILEQNNLLSSMSRRGNCWDNAVVESFFRSLKIEWVWQTFYDTRAEARRDIFEYIEVFYNRSRLHSTLGYKTPEEYESLRKVA